MSGTSYGLYNFIDILFVVMYTDHCSIVLCSVKDILLVCQGSLTSTIVCVILVLFSDAYIVLLKAKLGPSTMYGQFESPQMAFNCSHGTAQHRKEFRPVLAPSF